MSLVRHLFQGCVVFSLLTSRHCSASWDLNKSQQIATKPVPQQSSLYELSLGDILPTTFFSSDGHQSYNFVIAYFRLVGAATWPLTPHLVQSLHKVAKRTCSTTRFICTFTISLNEKYQGPCKDECRLEIFPKLDNGDACRLCGQQNHVWQNKAYAGLDVKASVNYTRDSMLIGTTVATFARDASKGLQAEGLQVNLLCLEYQPQQIAAMIAPYKPLAPLALKLDAWEIAFTVSGKSTLPFGVENEHKVLVALNAMEMTSQYSSFWRFKSIVEDNKKGHVNLVVVLTRQPDRHGVMDAQAASQAIEKLEQKLNSDGINWHVNFLTAKLAPEETIAGKFRLLAEVRRRDKAFNIVVWVLPVLMTLLVVAVTGLLLLGSPGMIILPWRQATYGSGSGSGSGSSGTSSGFGSGGTRSILTITGEGNRLAKAVPLIMGDEVEKADIEICKDPNGDGDWLLGRGASGVVYKGIKNGVQDVAVKVLINSDDLQVKLFQEEIKLLRSVSFDRNIVQFCGACLQPHDTMMILEYMAGGDLMRAISLDKQNELRWSRKGGLLMLDIARGLAFLHANRLIHMDLKSKNVLLSAKKDLAKIADVGLSRIIQSTLGGQSSNPFSMGTFEYTAPEILLGRYCTEKVDVYSFGVIMWEVASHEQPSRGRMRNLKVPEEVPAAIDALISRCMSEDPETRPTAKEAYDILRDWRDRQVEFLQQRKQSMDLRNLDAQGGKQDSPASPRTSNGLGSGLASLQSGSTASGDTSTQLS